MKHDSNKLRDDRLKALLKRHDEPAPQAPTGEWSTIRARALESGSAPAPLWRFVLMPAGVAAAALLAVVLLRQPQQEPLPPVSMAALPLEDQQVAQMLEDDSYFEDLEAEDEGYLALLQ